MNKKGFTLVELLAVIAIIAILTVLVVPSVVKVNQNVNKRLLSQKNEYIESAAELYGSNNPDIFQGADVVEVTVYDLLKAGYLKIDSEVGTGSCIVDDDNLFNEGGCLINPVDKTSMNAIKVILTKKSAGIVAELESSSNSLNTNSETLITKVCNGFANAQFDGKYGTGENDFCECYENPDTHEISIVKKGTEEQVDYCVIVSNKESGDVDNWLKYGASEANWRVLGLYYVDTTTSSRELSAKMITSGVVK